MSLIEAFIIGLLQGVTEFLPISSSAHLKIAKLIFGMQSTEGHVVFDLICHLGTLAAVLFYLRAEILSLFRSERKKLGLLFVATLPLIPCYFLLKPLRDFASQPSCLGICLLCTAAILFAGQKLRFAPQKSSSVRDVLWIGTMQSAALIPGISRSASTISCARILGWSPQEAVRFSFLLSIPTIIGGNCLELLKITLSQEALPEISLPSCIIGFLASLVFGCLVIRFAIAFLEKGNLKPFAWYCFGLGVITTLYLRGF